jgi:tRNA pseudouridine-54 N-methylase
MTGARKTLPTRSVYAPGFKYRDSVHTDIRETFKAARRALTREAQRKLDERQQCLELDNVVTMPARGAK